MTSLYPSSPSPRKYSLTADSSHSTMGEPGDDGLGDTAVMPGGEDADEVRFRDGESDDWVAEVG